MDETGFSTVPSKIGKVISLKEMRRVRFMASAERGTMITMALAVNAGGGFIPPFYLFPKKNMQAVYLENASPGAAGVANESGWMKQDEFVKFMDHFIKYSHTWTENPTLLLLDKSLLAFIWRPIMGCLYYHFHHTRLTVYSRSMFQSMALLKSIIQLNVTLGLKITLVNCWKFDTFQAL